MSIKTTLRFGALAGILLAGIGVGAGGLLAFQRPDAGQASDRRVIQADASTTCEGFARTPRANVVINTARVIEKSFGPATGLPRACRLVGEIHPVPASQIGFELWLPLERWNGKFAVTGNTGFAGSLTSTFRMPFGYTVLDQLKRGYATAATDTGHRNGEGSDGRASFASGHPEAVIDFGYRAVHEMTVAAKALTESFYRRPIKHSYWLGMSTGGRQGLMEAQRFPADYDGIIVGAPPINLTWNWIRQVDAGLVVAKDQDHNLTSGSTLGLLHARVMAACDQLDGIVDGLIDDPRKCAVDPSVLQCTSNQTRGECLTTTQVEAAKRIYGGLKDPVTGAQLNPGLERGSELAWGNAFPAGAPHPASVSYFRWLVVDDGKWDWPAFDFRRSADYQTVLQSESRLAPVLNAPNPDLRLFRQRGGKLLHWHGWSDERVEPRTSTDYYENVLRRVAAGRTDPSAAQRDLRSLYRLFMLPGMTHDVGSGYGPNTFDMLTALEQWVEHGVAPDAIVATHATAGTVDRSRPICPYPQIATYKGTGDPNNAASFICRVR